MSQFGPKTPRGRSLKTIHQARRLVADAVRYVERQPEPEFERTAQSMVHVSGIFPADRARLMMYGAQILGRLIKECDLELRIRKLETPEQRKETASGSPAPH